jgi:hypothetical protein
MERFLVRIIIAGMLVIGWSGSAPADWKLDTGYTALQNELGAALLTGAGVKVTQVEAASGEPDPSNTQFAGKTFTYKNSLSVSSHATAVGQYFYGNTTSIAPGITSIDCYDSVNWRTVFLGSSTSAPLISSSRVANHSYINTSTSSSNVPYLARLDWLVNRDEYIQVVAMNNGGSNVPLLGSSFNAISVGLSNGTAAYGSYPLTTTITTSTPITTTTTTTKGKSNKSSTKTTTTYEYTTTTINTPYSSASTRPDLVAPASVTSWATPMVSSAAALLVAKGHQGGTTLSTDPAVSSTTNRNGDTIYNAERSEVVKAALMAGADRTATQLATTYSVNTANGLNNVYGAGQLNIDNSYHIISAGEQNSREDLLSANGEIQHVGFDYDPYFGGLNGSNKTGTYVFKALTTGSLAASLVWNLAVNSNFDGTATLYNLGLYLYDMTSSSEVAYATSLVDNTENIWYTDLIADHAYLLKVVSLQATDFLWDYALAWNITATTTHAPLPPTVYLLGSGIVAIIFFRRKKRVSG